MPDSVKPTNTESSSQDEDTNMKRPRDDASQTSSETEDSNVNNKDSESDKDNPSTSPSPKRPKHQAPQLIVFEWTSTDWSDPVDMNDNIDDKNDTPSNQDNSSDYKDVLDLLFDDSLVDIYAAKPIDFTQMDDSSQESRMDQTNKTCTSGEKDNLDEDDNESDDSQPSSPPPPPPPPKIFCELEQTIDTIDDLITVGQLYEEPDYHSKKYSVNIEGLHAMIPALCEFQEMIGLETIKKQVVDQIVYLSGKENHQQFASLAAEAETRRAREQAANHNKQGDRSNRSSSLLAQLFDGLSKNGKKEAASSKYSMTDSVTKDDIISDMFHTVIYGPPGVGKTVFAKLLARLFLNLGVTQNDTFRIARRSDLVGEYVGHTATKTQKVIDEAMGGVLFIDEVYALGNGGSTSGVGDGRVDSFSNECINTLNQNLTERKGEFICIIAGYKKETEKYFFDLNPGLKRRFSFYYNIDAYSWEELTQILMYKIRKLDNWSCENMLEETLLKEGFLRDKMKYFPHFAGDVETWLLNIKISHCKRVFGKAMEVQRRLTRSDIEAGYKRYVDQKFNNDEQRKLEEEMIRNLYS